jgi:hypothetical protein
MNGDGQYEHQTTNLGVRSSNLFGRASKIKDLVYISEFTLTLGVTPRVTADERRGSKPQ